MKQKYFYCYVNIGEARALIAPIGVGAPPHFDRVHQYALPESDAASWRGAEQAWLSHSAAANRGEACPNGCAYCK